MLRNIQLVGHADDKKTSIKNENTEKKQPYTLKP